MRDLSDVRVADAWALLLALAGHTRSSPSWMEATGFHLDRESRLETAGGDAAWVCWSPDTGWQTHAAMAPEVRAMFDLYLPLCEPSSARTFVIGHIGQSLDGCIATRSGDSAQVTGRENIVHLHRLRALCDAIVVGAETVASDNPRLTTRLVSGTSPTRIVIDPSCRLDRKLNLFTDGAAPTVIACEQRAARGKWPAPGELIEVPSCNGALDLMILLAELRHRGLRRIVVEGGGVTVSRFLDAGLLDRLHVAISPVLIGDGRRGLQLPGAATMQDCSRPRSRIYRMGDDVLFDCEPDGRAGAAPVLESLTRLV